MSKQEIILNYADQHKYLNLQNPSRRFTSPYYRKGYGHIGKSREYNRDAKNAESRSI